MMLCGWHSGGGVLGWVGAPTSPVYDCEAAAISLALAHPGTILLCGIPFIFAEFHCIGTVSGDFIARDSSHPTPSSIQFLARLPITPRTPVTQNWASSETKLGTSKYFWKCADNKACAQTPVKSQKVASLGVCCFQAKKYHPSTAHTLCSLCLPAGGVRLGGGGTPFTLALDPGLQTLHPLHRWNPHGKSDN